jgi:nucleotide-binding universal stress UspA family protein
VRAMYATDLGPSAQSTQKLLTSLAWPAASTIDVLHVLPLRRSSFFSPTRAPTDETLARTRLQLATFTAEMAGRLHGRGLTLRSTLRVGDTVNEIVSRAVEIQADVVMIGSQRRDGVVNLGSVATSLVDRAPCSVLIVRTESVSRILLADDGSPSADIAAAAIASWPIFSALPVTVVSVVDQSVPVLAGPYPQFPEPILYVEGSRGSAADLVERRLALLRARGRLVQGLVREGAAAAELLHVSKSLRADLLVLGSSSKAGLTRLLLGSVARSVVVRSDRSVLIARASAYS